MYTARRGLFELLSGAGTAARISSVNSIQASKPYDHLRDSYAAPTSMASSDEPGVVIHREFGARVEIYTGYQ